ncbi:ABC transporter permease [Petroclostridium xylanilyticum]|uniref:ABC transporter permease n=1 Tax=Petroclostridium xylanilyticum TaxID=1792311 RepID=UPI001FA8A893|nr:ABC transporter permease [Petroclostridium xylanilyticum]
MNEIMNSIFSAWSLIVSLDSEVYGIILLSLLVTVASTGGAAVLGIPIGIIVGSRNFIGKRLFVRVINTLMGLPPVVAGLVVYLFLSCKGPLGHMQLLFTPAAMVIAQIIIVLPIITGLTVVAVQLKYKSIEETCKGLGMSNFRIIIMLIHECKYPLFSALLAGYGRSISEVGAVMLVGGNIQYKTRVMTTSIVLETGKGNYDKALALGIILILVSFFINWILQRFQEAK